MSKEIQVGDLVRVVKVCCDQSRLGTIFVVTGFDDPVCYGCGTCGSGYRPEPIVVGIRGYDGIPVSWVKRIPPLEELEGQRTEEKLREPVCT